MNNGNKINPTYYLTIEEFVVQFKNRRIFTSLKQKELIIARSNGKSRHYILSDNMIYIQRH